MAPSSATEGVVGIVGNRANDVRKHRVNTLATTTDFDAQQITRELEMFLQGFAVFKYPRW